MKTRKSFLLLMPFALAACSGNGNGNGENDAGVDAWDAGGDGTVLCTTIADCPAKHLCIGGFCEPGTECYTEEDCPQGYTCNFMANVCVPEDMCETDGDCSESPAPYCETSSGLCVACLEDGHCTPDHCGPAFTCVECTDDTHCDGGMTCSPDNTCIDPSGCQTDNDCSDGQHCDPDDGRCYVCLEDLHCGMQKCDPASHQCVDCYLDDHCQGGASLCDPAGHTCVECLSDQDCLPGEHCHGVSHECTDFYCTSDSDCTEPATSWCDTGSGDCVECVLTSHCGYTDWCRDFQCQSGCLTDAECVEKYGENQHCDSDSGDCFEAECLTDNDCSDTPETPWCKTAASPSNPPQYTCVACTQDEHCDEYYECSPTEFTCRVMPCYRYDNPDETCHQIDPCYYCDMIEGNCGPAQECTYPDGNECCQGYTCNVNGNCTRNLDCETDLDCPVDSTCNQTYFQCEIVPCCDPPCSPGEYCNSLCECLSTCHEAGEPCDPLTQNCCEGLTCSMFWPMCTEI